MGQKALQSSSRLLGPPLRLKSWVLSAEPRTLYLAASFAAFLACFAAWPYVVPTNGLIVLGTSTLIYALVGEGLNFLYGISGQLSVAQGALWGVGAYVAALGFQRWQLDFWLALPLASLAGALVAAAIGYPARRIQGHYFVIVTFAFASILPIFANNAVGLTGGNQGIIVGGIPTGADLFGLDPLVGTYYITLAIYILGLVAAFALQFSRFGRRLFAARHNPVFARSLGMRVDRDRLLAFAASGAFAGVGGVVYAYSARYVQPDLFNVWSGITFVLIVMVGGRGLILGSLVGSVVAILVPHALEFSPVANRIVFGAILVLVILLLPRGILGAGLEAAIGIGQRAGRRAG